MSSRSLNRYLQGLHAILGDELEHDRQVQVVGLIALLQTKGIGGPFLIVSSVGSMESWAAELNRLLPSGLLIHRFTSAADSRDMLSLLCHAPGDSTVDPRLLTAAQHVAHVLTSSNLLNYAFIDLPQMTAQIC